MSLAAKSQLSTALQTLELSQRALLAVDLRSLRGTEAAAWVKNARENTTQAVKSTKTAINQLSSAERILAEAS